MENSAGCSLQLFVKILWPALAIICTCSIACLAVGEPPASFSPNRPAAVFRETLPIHTPPPAPLFDPRSYGARGDGVTYDTAAIQKAIDVCAGTTGSVVLRAGTFLSAELTLKGGMTFYVDKGATLLGGLKPEDYPVLIPPDTAGKGLQRSLLYANRADHLTIDGQGVIDGRGKDVAMHGKEPMRPSLLRIFFRKLSQCETSRSAIRRCGPRFTASASGWISAR